MIDMFIDELNKKVKKIMKVEVRNNNVEQALRILKRNTKRTLELLKKKNTKRRKSSDD